MTLLFVHIRGCGGLLLVGRLECLAVQFDHLVGDVLRDVFVAVQRGSESTASTRDGAQFRGVAEQFGLGHAGGDDLHSVLRVHAQDTSTAAVEVTVDVAHVYLRDPDLYGHDRLHESRLALEDALLEGHGRGDLERELVRVDRVERAVI